MFMQGYANSSVCSATRTALATGRYQYPLEVGLEEPINASTAKSIGLPPSHPTLPSLLKKAGYGTTLVGKWHLGFLPDFSPLQSGYDTSSAYSAALPTISITAPTTLAPARSLISFMNRTCQSRGTGT
jgi:arylsulfatase A-like enzyme